MKTHKNQPIHVGKYTNNNMDFDGTCRYIYTIHGSYGGWKLVGFTEFAARDVLAEDLLSECILL